MKDFIKKLQSLSETKKKVIMFSVVTMVGLVLGYFWITSAAHNITKIGSSLQSINLPKIDIPNIPALNSVVAPDNAQQTQSANGATLTTADWKTYTNDQYGFEIQYPNDWLSPIQEDSKNTIDFNGKVLITYYKSNSDLPGNSKNDYSLDEWLLKNNYAYLDNKTIENTIVGDNYPAIKINENYCKGNPVTATMYFAETKAGSINMVDGGIFQIEGPILQCQDQNISQEYDAAEKTFSDMLSTFKFITSK